MRGEGGKWQFGQKKRLSEGVETKVHVKKLTNRLVLQDPKVKGKSCWWTSHVGPGLHRGSHASLRSLTFFLSMAGIIKGFKEGYIVRPEF